MLIRKFRKNSSLRLLVGLSIVIALGMWAIIRYIGNLEGSMGENGLNGDAIPDLPYFSYGEMLSESGTITSENQFPLYTNLLTTKDNKKFGLKSSSINMNNYTGYIEILGTMGGIIKSMPMIDVKAIKIPNDQLIVNDNSYFFVKELLFFDFTEQPGFRAAKSGKDINVYFNDILLINIKAFECEKNTKDRDCSKIGLDLGYNMADSFMSYIGYDYYRYSTGGWITFNKDLFGYIFKPKDDDTILDISNVVTIIDSKNIMIKKKDVINEKCQKDGETLQDATSIEMFHDIPREVKLVIKGKSNRNNGVNCNITFDLRNQWNVISAIFN